MSLVFEIALFPKGNSVSEISGMELLPLFRRYIPPQFCRRKIAYGHFLSCTHQFRQESIKHLSRERCVGYLPFIPEFPVATYDTEQLCTSYCIRVENLIHFRVPEKQYGVREAFLQRFKGKPVRIVIVASCCPSCNCILDAEILQLGN